MSVFKGIDVGLESLLELDGERFVSYAFENAGQLLEDFWKDVNRICK